MWNHAPQQQQQVGPPPHGHSIGLFKVIYKDPVTHGTTRVIFEAASGTGEISILMNTEDANYFSIGQTYNILATQP